MGGTARSAYAFPAAVSVLLRGWQDNATLEATLRPHREEDGARRVFRSSGDIMGSTGTRRRDLEALERS